MLHRILKLPVKNSFFLLGPRMTGKSTLIRSAFSEHETLSYNLLLSEDYQRFSAHPYLLREEVAARRSNVCFIFIDEIQRVPELLNEVHAILETDPSPPVFILTGSSARKLKRSSANLLAGRAWTYQLFPFTYLELGEHFSLQKALSFGTLPKVYLADEDEAKLTLRSYVDTYLKEEIEAEALIRSTGTFLRFLFQAGHQSSEIVNFSNIARDVGSSHTTVKEYYQILEDTLLGFMLPSYQKSARKRLSKHPRFYLFDTGVQRALTKKLNLNLEKGTTEFGSAFEHFIVNQFRSLSSYFKNDFEFSYYRTEAGAEVDLIVETPHGDVFAVEIKSSATPSVSDFRSGLESFKQICPKAICICLCTAENPRNAEGFEILPWKMGMERVLGSMAKA